MAGNSPTDMAAHVGVFPGGVKCILRGRNGHDWLARIAAKTNKHMQKKEDGRKEGKESYWWCQTNGLWPTFARESTRP